MYRIVCLLIGAFFMLSCAKTSSTSNATLVKNENTKARVIYGQYCSSCHGEKVEAFVDRKWKHGQSKDEIIASITNGYNDAGMPAWKGVVSEQEINELADLIVNSLNTVKAYDFKEVEKTDTHTSKGITVKLETMITGLSSPWGMLTLPNGDLLVTDRSGDLWKVAPDKSKAKISGIPAVNHKSQGGLFEVILDPDYIVNKWIYLSYAKKGDDNTSTTAILRGKLEGNTLVNKEEIFEALPYVKASHHYGARMVFDQMGYLYISVGDRGNRDENPQTLKNALGKIHRINANGSVPNDNPFYNTPDATKSIWSLGHRNPQGLVLNNSTGSIWEHEHGPRGGDEINIIRKGENYGWPVISYGINYNATTFTNITEKEGMLQPELYWIPSIAPCGMAYVTSDKYPAWQGDLLAGSLRYGYLNRVELDNNKVQEEEKLLINIGRMRNVVQASDGYIYVGTEKPGTVYRLVPQP